MALHRRLAAARRDPLTGLLTRTGWTARARRLIDRHGDRALVVLVDADHFKTINDTHGHAAGDAVLTAIADRLTAWAGSRGVVGRLGGDEFTAALPSVPHQHLARLEQLTDALARPVHHDRLTVEVAASVGAASPTAVGTHNLDALLRAADAAMYRVKHTGAPGLAGPEDLAAPCVNGRRAGRPGTGEAANGEVRAA